MGNITLAPEKKIQKNSEKLATSERKILDVISKGGSPMKYEQTSETEEIKQINIRLFASEVKAIRTLREKIPTSSRRGKRLAISLHDWIIEAVQEKIKRDLKKNQI